MIWTQQRLRLGGVAGQLRVTLLDECTACTPCVHTAVVKAAARDVVFCPQLGTLHHAGDTAQVKVISHCVRDSTRGNLKQAQGRVECRMLLW